MSCNNPKCQSWLCILRSRALRALDSSSHRSSSSASFCNQESFLASPSSTLQERLNNSESSVARDRSTIKPLDYSVRHDGCSTTQSLKEQLGVDTSESFAWTSALETPAKSVQPQGPSLQDQNLGSSFCELPSDAPSNEKHCHITLNNQSCRDPCEMKHRAVGDSEHQCDSVLPEQAHNLSVRRVHQVSKKPDEENLSSRVQCQRSSLNSSKTPIVMDNSASSGETNINLSHNEESDHKLTSTSCVTKDLPNSCSYILDSVSPKLRRRSRNNAFNAKPLARSLFKHEPEAPSNCTRPAMVPAVEEPGAGVAHRRDQESCVDDAKSTDKLTGKPSIPHKDGYNSESNEASKEEREMRVPIDSLVKESETDECAGKFYDLKKSPTIASRTPLNRLRKLPFKTSTPLLGSALFSVVRSQGKENLDNAQKISEMSIGRNSGTSAKVNREVEEGIRPEIGNKTVSDVSQGNHLTKTEVQTSVIDAKIWSVTEGNINPIDLLCSPVKKLKHIDSPGSSAVAGAQDTCHRTSFEDVTSSPFLPSKTCTVTDHSKERKISPICEATGKSSESQCNISKNEFRISSPTLLHKGGANVASISSVQNLKNELEECSHALPSISSYSMAKTMSVQSSDIMSENNKTSALSAQTTSNLKPPISANGSTQSTSFTALPNSGSITAPVTNSVCMVLETSENSHNTAPSLEKCITPMNTPLLDPNVGNTSCSSMSSAMHSPVSTPVTHRKPRRLSLSARGAQKLEMLKKKINPSSSFIYPSSILERSHRASTLKHSESIHTNISSCGFIDADVTASVPPVGTTAMKRDHRPAATSSPLLPDHELTPKARSIQENTGVQIENCTKQALTYMVEFTTPTSSFRAGGHEPCDSSSSRINISSNHLSNNHDHDLDFQKSFGLGEFHHQTDSAKNIDLQNYMNSEELAEVDDILQNCDLDFDDAAQISGEKKTDYNSSNALLRTKDATSSAKNTVVLHPSPVGDGKSSASHPAIGFAFQTGRGATVQVSKEAVARAATLWREASTSEASGLPGCNSEADQFTVPSVGKKFVLKNNFDSGLNAEVNTEKNSCSVNNEAVVPEVDVTNIEILSASKRLPCDVEASTSMEESRGTSKGFGGFKTAAGNDVKVNEEAIKKAMRLWSECGDLKTTSVRAEEMSSFSGFSTAGGAKVETNSLALADAKLRLDKIKFSAANPKDSCNANGVSSNMKEDGFVTASGKPVKTSADAIEKAKRIWNDCDLPGSVSTSVDPKSASGGFSSAKGSRLPLSHDSLLKAQQLWDECAQADMLDDNFAATSEPKFDGFKTASGAQVCVSDKALRTAKNLLNSIEEVDSEQIHSKQKITDKFTVNPVSKTPTARPSKKGFIKHKIVHKNMSGLSSGLPEPDTYYSKIRSDLSRRIYPTNTSSKKSSSKVPPNDASPRMRMTANLSAEEKAILDSQFQDITEEFLNDDWNMEPEVWGKPPGERSDSSSHLGTEKSESLALQGEKRKISFPNEINSKRGKTATSAEDLDAEHANAAAPHLPDDAPVMSSSPKSPAPVDVQCPRSCNEEAKSFTRHVSFDTECLSLHDGKAPTADTVDSVDSVSIFAGKIMPNSLHDSPTTCITSADRLRDSQIKLSTFKGAPHLLVSEKTPLDPLSCDVNIEGRNIANTSSKNLNSSFPSNSLAVNPSVNSENIISPPISVAIKLNLNSVCDSKTSVETSVVESLATTDSVNNSTLALPSNFGSGSMLKPSTGETICSSKDPPDWTNCTRPDASPVLARSKQIKKKIQYLRDVYGAPKSLSPLPTSPAVLRMPFRAPFKKKLSVDE